MTTLLNTVKTFFNDLQKDYKFNKYVKKVNPQFNKEISALMDVYETGYKNPKIKEYIEGLNLKIDGYIFQEKANKLAAVFGKDSKEYKDFVNDFTHTKV